MPLILEEVAILGLTELKMQELSLEEVWAHLQAGDYVVVERYEETRGKDVLVRLDKRRHTVTQISFDVEPVAYGERYWAFHGVTINALSLNKVYLYDEAKFLVKTKFKPLDIVYYSDAEVPRQIAVVDKVFYTLAGVPYYTLQNVEGYYSEAELFKDSQG